MTIPGIVGDPFFRSPLYAMWNEALASYVKREAPGYSRLYTHLSADQNRFIPRLHYDLFVQILRDGLNQKMPEARKVVRYIYLEADYIFPNLYQHFFSPTQETANLEHIICHWDMVLHHRGLDGFGITCQDTFAMGNLPYPLHKEVFPDFTTQFFRTPHVLNSTGLHPEYSALLASLAENKESCLYVNSMSFATSMNEEPLLCTHLHILEAAHPALIVTTLDRDSDVYLARGNLQNMEDYKKYWLNYLFDSDSVRWSGKLDAAIWRKKVERILDFVHAHYFENLLRLSQVNKQVFHELCYAYILYEHLITLKPTVCHVSCLVSADRGPSLFTLLYALLALKRKEDTGTEFYKKLTSLLLGPAAAFCNRPAHSDRVTLCLACINLVLKKGEFVYVPYEASEEEVTQGL